VASKPFIWEGEKFFIVTLNNVEDIKRRERLEKAFFHDLLNRAGILQGLVELLLQSKKEEKINMLIEILHKETLEIVDDILFQQNLMEAEQGRLVVQMDEINSLEILEGIRDEFIAYESKENKAVVVDPSSSGKIFYSDKALLKRILTNILKNALEAIKEGESIVAGTKKSSGQIQFWVQNPGVIPDEIQSQIFQRSFSTKGKGSWDL